MQYISNKTLVTNLKVLVESINSYNGKWFEERSTKVGDVIEYDPWSAPITSEAMKFLYDNNLIVDFDWGSWNEGREFFKNNNPNKYDSIDRETVLKLLTAVARNDRFCDGAWAGLFENGTAQKLFQRLLEIEGLQLNTNNL